MDADLQRAYEMDTNLRSKIAELKKQNGYLKELIKAQDELLVAYRLGSHAKANTAIDKIRELKRSISP